ncbi:MAG TPA: type II toxin-antitoxin system RelE/ParE family toxin [Pirellulales bacterium]|nr:type II toxin-antitoxin system RelE/ParE family toxin [Pirellulales bacterium]
MSLAIVFRREARLEFDEAADWYEQRRAGLGARFVEAVQHVLNQAAANPQRYGIVDDDLREGVVRGFPFCVYYREEAGQIVVFAVFHSSRDPSIWRPRR